MKRNKRLSRFVVTAVLCVIVFAFTTMGLSASGDPAAATETAETVFTVGETEYDLTDSDSALEYTSGYADNLQADPAFEQHLDTAMNKVREQVPLYASVWALLPPVIAIVLALITKEVYSSLLIGIVTGGLLYANFGFEGTVNHIIADGFIGKLSDSYNVGILFFLVMLGALVALMNHAGGSAAFGRWATSHIKSPVGARLATICLGVLIFIDDYFNCLTVGSVMRPVTDKQNISRAKLAYIIDATAAPICIIAPISSWAAAVSGFVEGSGATSGMALFISAIPYNFYALLTIAMLVFLAVTGIDFGPMKKYEKNARENGDVFSAETRQAVEEMEVNPRGRVCDLVIPIVFLILACVVGMIYSGGFFTADSGSYHDFIDAFSNSDASVGLAYGSFFAIIFTVIFYLCRRVLSFRKCMDCVPEGFRLMVPAIMILTCAWTLKAMTDSLGATIFISQWIRGSAGAFALFLPAVIFLIAVGLSFSTGTSWGTFGILIPIVLGVFGAQDGVITTIAISACMAGAVCGDHCSPISDTTIMASAGAQCDHITHVSTQLPYALLVAAVSFVGYVLCGFIQSAWVVLPICIVLLFAVLWGIKLVQKKQNA